VIAESPSGSPSTGVETALPPPGSQGGGLAGLDLAQTARVVNQARGVAPEGAITAQTPQAIERATGTAETPEDVEDSKKANAAFLAALRAVETVKQNPVRFPAPPARGSAGSGTSQLAALLGAEVKIESEQMDKDEFEEL